MSTSYTSIANPDALKKSFRTSGCCVGHWCDFSRIEMSGTVRTGASPPTGQLPHQQIALAALQTGAFTGFAGLVVGGASGVVRSSSPTLFAVASGIQWFALGSVYSAAKGVIHNAWGVDKLTSRDRIYASGLAGGFAGGSVGYLTRGRANVIPGTIMFAAFGLVGQGLYNALNEKHAEDEDKADKKNFLQRVANSKWSPMKILSDDEYEDMLREKLLRVDAEIALVDEAMERLRASSTEADTKPTEK
ncbi:MAG: hypothetical protein M1819_004419 [Sarea resinae]|nr:MAG: hypothetical protein M1819_004419 [Sarea resinae]